MESKDSQETVSEYSSSDTESEYTSSATPDSEDYTSYESSSLETPSKFSDDDSQVIN